MKKAIFILVFCCTFLSSSYIDIDSFFKDSKANILIVDPITGDILNANKEASKFYGTTIAELKKKNIDDINVFTKKQIEDEMNRAKQENRNYFIFQHKVANGKIEKVEVHSFPILYDDKKVLFSIIQKYEDKYAVDEFNKNLEEQVNIQTKEIQRSKRRVITIFVIGIVFLILLILVLVYLLGQKRKLAKKIQTINDNLSKANERFEIAIEATKDGLYDWDFKTNKIFLSNTWKEMFGYKKDEKDIDLKEWHLNIHPLDIQKVKDDFDSYIKGNKPCYENIHRIKHKDGHWVWVLDRGKAIFDENNKIQKIIGFHTDISLQKENEKRIEEQKEEFKTIFYNSNEAIAIIDLDTKFLNFNDAYVKMTGFTKEELLSKTCLELTSDYDDRENTKEIIKQVLQEGHVENIEKNCVLKDNKTLYVSMNIALMPDKKRMILTTRDITKAKRLQSQEKLASMGEMIGNIAHQWRQPLSIITTTISGMKLQKEAGILSDEIFEKSIDSILGQATYLSETIDDFRTYIKNDKEKIETTIQIILNRLLSLSEATIKDNNINLKLNIKDDIKIIGYKNELVQALINIINNAVDAIKENLKGDSFRLIIIETKKLEDGLELYIKDNANGIKNDILNRVFEPYFTTKHKSMGTGIGLSLAYEILTKHHNAQISVVNERFKYEDKYYRGAKFIIKFKNP